MNAHARIIDRRDDQSENLFSDVDPLRRYRKISQFTEELTDLCRKHGVAIVGGRVEQLDVSWKGPDAEQWEQYAINEDDFLVRGFWNQHSREAAR